MAKNNKGAERANLLVSVGRLMAPLIDLAERSTPPTADDLHIASARYHTDFHRWLTQVHAFVTAGIHVFGHIEDQIIMWPNQLQGELHSLAGSVSADPLGTQATLARLLSKCHDGTVAAIARMPIAWEAELLSGETPLSTHLRIRDVVLAASRRIHLFDRYLNDDVFPLYLRPLSRGVQIKLLTTRGTANFGVTNLLPMARLAAKEFKSFELVECSQADMHDRNLRIDDQIFFLGPSLSHAGTHPTNFSPTDSSAAAHAVLDGLIAKGTIIT